MDRRRRRTASCVPVLVGVLAAVLLTGCSAPLDTEEPRTAGPLSDYLDEFQESSLAHAERERVAVAEAVAACMHEQGFDHAPYVDSWTSEIITVPPEHSTVGWAEQHGYGLVDGSAVHESVPGEPDPNAELVASMSEAERDAYLLALLGPPDAPEDGCYEEAAEPVDVMSDETYAHLLEEVGRLDAEAHDTPEVAAALDAWRTCMDDEGLTGHDSPRDALDDVTERVHKADPTGSGRIPEPARSELLTLERRVATASRRCEERSRLPLVLDEAVRAAQVAYVEEHRAELDAWALTWADGRTPGTTAG